MPKVHRRNRFAADGGRTVAERGHYQTVTIAEAGRPCIGGDHCPHLVVPDCPVALCGRHLHEVYGFAADMVSENWDTAVREYVSDLHGTFKPPRAVKQPLTGWVYFIRFSDRIKVGYTTNVDQRLANLPYDQIIGVVEGSRQDEKAWHRLLADFHVVGEWFRAEPEVLKMLERVAGRTA